MITWTDFIFDDVLGPVLISEENGEQVSRTPGRSEIMDDERTIQETRRGQQPARMVGEFSLETVRSGKDAERAFVQGARQRREG